jgi:hypothetical protein
VIIVGNAKPQALILREESMECIEFTAPFNPRGNGYQVPLEEAIEALQEWVHTNGVIPSRGPTARILYVRN